MEIQNLQTVGEPGAIVYVCDCARLMSLMPPSSVDAIFADPPYRLSGGGPTVQNGRLAYVNKGKWDRPRGLTEDHEFNVRWLRQARRVLKPDATIWVTGTHHIIFSLGFALQSLGFKVLNQISWVKPNAAPNALHTTFHHVHETLIWAARSRSSRHTFNYELLNSADPSSQMSTVWRLPTVSRTEKAHGYHPTQKPLRLVRRALLASTAEGDLVLDPFTGSGTTAVAARELNRSFVGAESEADYADLAARRIRNTPRGSLLPRLRRLQNN